MLSIKFFEQLLSKQATSKLDSCLSKYQSTYSKGLSCETALIRLVEDWKSAIDDGKYVEVISTDTSKAFDSLLPVLMI